MRKKTVLWKLRSAAVFVAALFVLQTAGVTAGASSIKDSDKIKVSYKVTYKQTEARKSLQYVNRFRTGNTWYYTRSGAKKTVQGLKALTYDYDLEKSAMQRACEIAAYFDHVRPDGRKFNTAYKSASCCENLCSGPDTAEKAFKVFEESGKSYAGQGHRRNMLGNYTAFAVGHCVVNGRHYWAMEFRNPVKSTTPTAANDSLTAVSCKMSVKNLKNPANAAKVRLKPSVSDCKITVKIKNLKPQVTVKYGKKTLTNGKDYTYTAKKNSSGKYKVKVSGKGIFAGSKTISSKVKIAKPGKVKASYTLNGIKISWNKVPGATSYVLMRSTGGKYKTLAKIKGGSRTYFYDKKTDGKHKYSYKLKAKIGKRSGKASSKAVIKGLAATKIKSVSSGSDKNGSYVLLSWKELSGAKLYNIYRADLTDGTSKHLTVVDSSRQRTVLKDYSVIKGHSYRYRVSAKYKAGPSALAESSKIRAR